MHCGVMDKHYHFIPIRFLFANKKDAEVCTYFLQSIRDYIVELFGIEPDVKFTLNDNDNAEFKAFNKVFLESLQ